MKGKGWKIVKYGIPLLIAARLGGCVAMLEYDSQQIRYADTEPLPQNRSLVEDPRDERKYVIDFDAMRMERYDDYVAHRTIDDDSLDKLVRR